MAFITATPLHAARVAAASAVSSRRAPCSRVAVPRASRRARVAMSADDSGGGGGGGGDDELPATGIKTKAQQAEEEVVQTWQGNAWFAVIMGGMFLGVAATMARDFVPGGGPAVM